MPHNNGLSQLLVDTCGDKPMTAEEMAYAIEQHTEAQDNLREYAKQRTGARVRYAAQHRQARLDADERQLVVESAREDLGAAAIRGLCFRVSKIVMYLKKIGVAKATGQKLSTVTGRMVTVYLIDKAKFTPRTPKVDLTCPTTPSTPKKRKANSTKKSRSSSTASSKTSAKAS